MPLKFSSVKGKPALFYLVHRGTLTTAPSAVTVTVDTAGATAGANIIPITDPGTDIPKNTVLTFDDANTTKVVVTTTFTSGSAGDLAVESFEGADGDGIENALTAGDAASWDGLYTDIASNSLDFQNNAQTQDLTAVTHGSTTGVTVANAQVTSIAPSVQRQGLFFADGQLIQDLLTYGDTNAYWYGKFVQPDATGAAKVTRAGYGLVQSVGTPTPADNLIQLSYTFRFLEAVTPSFAA